MPHAVRFTHYGGLEVLEVVTVAMPQPSGKEVVVKVKAAGINPGEDKIRQGFMHSRFPATFPSGEGTDFAGIVDAIGSDVTAWKIGDEVAGHTDNRASHAEYVLVEENNLVAKPASVSWEVAGSLWVVATTAYASVAAVDLQPKDTVVVSGAGGGVGSLAAQLAKLAGATVYGIAGKQDGDWLTSLGITPLDYNDDVMAKIKTIIGTPDAFIDTVGKGYVQMAIDVGVKPERINTIIDFDAVGRYGVKSDGSAVAANNKVLKKLLQLLADGSLTLPIAKTFPLEEVRAAFTFLTTQHHRGKVVLIP